MKIPLPIAMSALIAFATTTGCNADPKPGDPGKGNQMKVTIGAKTFLVTLEDNETAKAFKAMLPLTVKMADLHGNEKFHRFPKNLPTKDANPGTIRTGDLMIWSSNTLVLFYEDFRTSYSYTRLGRVSNPSQLAETVGSGDVTMTFEAN